MANYKPDLSGQNCFIAVDFEQQIIPGTFEYALSRIIDKHIDLTVCDSLYQNDNGGAAAYPPSIMLKIILFAYSRGIITSRRIANACEKNITFMALSGDVQPHYTSIARFVAKLSQHIETVFTQVLMICEQQNLIAHHMFAIDGCKITSNASKEWSGKFEELSRKEARMRRASARIIAKHQQQDEMGENDYQADIKQKQKLDAGANKIKRFLAVNKERLGARKNPIKSNITDNDSAKMTTSKGTIQGYNGIAIADDKNQIVLHAKAVGSVGEQQTLQPAVEQLKTQLTKLGKTQPFKGAKFTADSGFHSKDNLAFLSETELDCYIADIEFRSRNPLFMNSETYQKEQAKKRKKRHNHSGRYFTHRDFSANFEQLTCTCPAGKPMWCSNKNMTCGNKAGMNFTGYLKHCRQCPIKNQCMQKPPSKTGRQVFMPHPQQQNAPDLNQQMKDKIDSPDGRRQYSKRLGCIEPVFGNITANKGMNKLTLRGQTKVNAQWQAFCLVHNIEKLRDHLDT